MKSIHFGALTLLGAIWGASFLFIRVAAHSFGPLGLMWVRVTLAVLVLLIYSASLKALPRHLVSRWRECLIVGALNSGLPFVLIAFSELTITASMASIMNSMTPLCTAIVASLWIGEALTPRRIIGAIMGIFGVFILVGGANVPIDATNMIAVGASLLAAVFYGVGTVYASRHFTGEKPLNGSIGQLSGASMILLIPALFSVPSEVPPTEAWLALLALALLSTSFAYLLYFYLINNVGPTRTASVTFLVPVFGTIWGVLFLNEPFNPWMLLGMTIILLSVGLVTGLQLSIFKRA